MLPTSFEICGEEQFSAVVAVLQLKVWFRITSTSALRADVHVRSAFFLATDEAVGGLIAVRKVQIWGRNIVSEIMALNARSQDFGGLCPYNQNRFSIFRLKILNLGGSLRQRAPYILMAYIVMAYIVMADIVMVLVFMAYLWPIVWAIESLPI